MIPLKRRPMLWVLIPALALVFGYAQTYANPLSITGNRQAAVSFTALLLFVSAPMAAVCAAIEASAEKKSQGVTETAVRSVTARLFARTWPSILGGFLIQTLAMLLFWFKAGKAVDTVPWILPLSLYAAILLHALAGYLLGRFLPKVLAIAAALAGSYLWVAFAWTVEPVQIRYMAGPVMALCCSSDQVLDTRAPLTLLVFSLLVAAAVAIFLWVLDRGMLGRNKEPMQRILGALLLAGTLAIAVFAGLLTGAGLGIMPTRPMPADRISCSSTRPVVCLSDVQLAREDPRPLIAETFRALEPYGLQKINRVVSSGGQSTQILSREGVANVAIGPLMSTQDIVHSAASTYASALGLVDCGTKDSQAWSESKTLFGAWLDATASKVLPPQEAAALRESAQQQVLEVPRGAQQLALLEKQSVQQQRSWAIETTKRLSRCEGAPAVTSGTTRNMP